MVCVGSISCVLNSSDSMGLSCNTAICISVAGSEIGKCDALHLAIAAQVFGF
jgi:hypothetical protein